MLPEAYYNRPELYPDLVIYWKYFMDISSSRSAGMGIECLKISEIKAYCDLIGVETAAERLLIMRRVCIIDDEVVKYHQKENSKEK